MDLRNWEFYVDNGTALVGASVYIRDAILGHPNTGTVVASVSTDSNGMWAVTGLTSTPKDVEVVWGNVSQYHKWYKGMTQHNVDAIFFSNPDRSKWRNRLINPNFGIQGRVLATTDNSYGPDRWRLLLESATAATHAQETSDTPSGGSHTAAKLVVATANKKSGWFQIIEGAEIWDLRGGKASLQFWMKVNDARVGDVRAAVVQWTGTEDNGGTAFPDPINVWGATGTVPTYTGSWANANTPANLSPTTSWAQYKIENIAISGSATNLAVFVWLEDQTTNVGDYLLLTDLQLESGLYTTPLERRSLAQERLLAERFAWTHISGATAGYAGTGQAVSATAGWITVALPNTMRTKPTTLTLASGIGNYVVTIANGTAAAIGALAINAASTPNLALLGFTGSAGLVAGNATQLWSAANFTLDAEL